MKKVAINTRFLIKNKLEGFGWFTYYTAKYLVEQNPDVQFYFLFDRKFDANFVFGTNVTPVLLFPQARHPLLFRWWFDYSVTRFLKKNDVDVFISPDGYLSLRTDVPQIAVIHDLNFEHFPEDLKPHHAKYLRKNFPLFARKAAHIVTVSDFSKEDIVCTYGMDRAKISVAHNGVNSAFDHHVDTYIKDAEPYFLFVGSIHPRKNLKRLLLAFDLFKKKSKSNHRLRVVGDPYYWSSEMKSTLENLHFKSAIDFKPYASVEDLKRHYQHAEALMFVSYFEGFGIPVVEAMACGCPVVVGQQTACDEVAANAAHKVDSFDVQQIADAMLLLSTNSAYRNNLIVAGLERAKDFNWENTGQVMNRVMHQFLR